MHNTTLTSRLPKAPNADIPPEDVVGVLRVFVGQLLPATEHHRSTRERLDQNLIRIQLAVAVVRSRTADGIPFRVAGDWVTSVGVESPATNRSTRDAGAISRSP